MEEEGFYVKVRDNFYLGPFDTLKKARDEARLKDSNLLIYHGTLKKISKDVVNDSMLFLVPKCTRE